MSSKKSGKRTKVVKDVKTPTLSDREAKGVRGGSKRIPGTVKFGDVTLKRGITDSH